MKIEIAYIKWKKKDNSINHTTNIIDNDQENNNDTYKIHQVLDHIKLAINPFHTI